MDKNRIKRYRIRNWSAYNKALIARGNITIWIEDGANKWLEKKLTGRRGRSNTYSDEAILCALMVRSVFRLPLRAVQGFLESIFHGMHKDLPVPCYTRICRRASKLGQDLRKLIKNNPTQIVIDSTGIKFYGEGEWKVRQHGKEKKRKWRKVHLAVCPDTHAIVLSELTESSCSDARGAKKMIQSLPQSVKKVYADGAYDQSPFYKILYEQHIEAIIPPRKNARVQNLEEKPWLKHRNQAITTMLEVEESHQHRKKRWSNHSGYGKRSLVETSISRFKRLFTGEFRSRKISTQKAELYAKSLVMNKMTSLGMPESTCITT